MIFGELSAAGLTAIVTSLLGVLGLLSSFRNFRSAGQQRFRNLEERTKAVAFWTAWLDAQAKVSTDAEMADHRAAVQKQLNDLATFVAHDAGATARQAWFANLLMLRAPRRVWAWAPRVLYYTIGSLGLAYAAASLVVIAQTRVSSEEALGVSVKYLATVALFVVVAAILRQIALLMEGPGGPPPNNVAAP